MKDKYDVVIIGAGVIGCSIARELSRFSLSVLVIDRESDIGEGTSKANSGIVHAGFDAKPGSLKALLNVRGSLMMDQISADLDVPFKRIGAMVLAFSEGDMPALERLKDSGDRNGVKGIRILGREEALSIESGLTDDVCAALYVPSSGIVCPFELTLAFAENAYRNGAEFSLSTEVTDIGKAADGSFVVSTTRGDVGAKVLVNAAGVYTDRIHNMISKPAFKITARKGEYMLMDKSAADIVSHTIFQPPTKMGKGVLVTPTVHGNLLVGPTAYDIEDKEDISTTRDGIGIVRQKSTRSIRDIPYRKVITSFSGLRATGDTGDFIIREDPETQGLVDVAGIESPGLSSAPAIGPYVCDIVTGILERMGEKPEAKPDFDPYRKGIPRLAGMSAGERQALIAENPDYGQIICRCEEISEGEILDAIRRPLGATTLDGIKRRVRAGMGRCQGGFCSPRAIDLLAQELGISRAEVRKNGVI